MHNRLVLPKIQYADLLNSRDSDDVSPLYKIQISLVNSYLKHQLFRSVSF